MKQLFIFDNAFKKLEKPKRRVRSYWKLFIDGASRNNPGPSGAGLFLLKQDQVVEKKGFFIGKKTNNQSEYLALLLGIFYLKKHLGKDDLVVIVSDSQLLVRQLQGKYRVKNPELKLLHSYAKEMLNGVAYDIIHVLREENKEADALANNGIDKKKKLPAAFLDQLHERNISI